MILFQQQQYHLIKMNTSLEIRLLGDEPDEETKNHPADAYPYPIEHLDTFFRDIHTYYCERGYSNYVTHLIVDQVIILLGLGFFILLTQYINRSAGIVEPVPSNTITFWGFIFFVTAMLISIYWLLGCCSAYVQYKSTHRLHRLFTQFLQIPDEELDLIEFDSVITLLIDLHRLGQLPSIRKQFDHLDVTGCIMRQNNFLIGLLAHQIIPEHNLTSVTEVVYRFLLLRPLYQSDGRWNQDFLINPEKFRGNLTYYWIGSIILIPFLVIAHLINFFLCNIAELWQKKTVLGPREWTTLAQWKLREYNELSHHFQIRLSRAELEAKKFLDESPSYMTMYLCHIVVFVSGAIVATILALSIVNPVMLTDSRSGLYLVIFGAIAAVGREFLSSAIPSPGNLTTYGNAVRQHTHLARSREHGFSILRFREQLTELYRYKIFILVDDVISIMKLPCLISDLHDRAPTIFEFITRRSVNRHLGRVFSDALLQERITLNPKLASSITTFQQYYPTWKRETRHETNEVPFDPDVDDLPSPEAPEDTLSPLRPLSPSDEKNSYQPPSIPDVSDMKSEKSENSRPYVTPNQSQNLTTSADELLNQSFNHLLDNVLPEQTEQPDCAPAPVPDLYL